MKNVYVAASFAYEDKEKTTNRKQQIEEVVNLIKNKLGDNFSFFLPHNLKIENAWDISLEEWSNKVYQHDIRELNKADIVLFISFGKENNAGSVWEVGYAVGFNVGMSTATDYVWDRKKVICIKMTDDSESLMVTNSVDILLTKEEIETYDWSSLRDFKTKLDRIS